MSSPAPTISYPESTIPRPLWEYVAHIRISVDELRDLQAAPAASVRVFLGSPPSGPTEWPTAVNLAGAFHVKVPVSPRSVIGRNVSPRIGWRDRGHASEAVEGSGGRYNAIIPDLGDKAEASASVEDGNTHSANREGSKGNINEGYVHLNAAISRHFQPGLFNPEVIVPYLTKTLQWRVQKGNGSPIEPESLSVIVFATPLSYPPDSICPVSGQRTYYKDITYGRKAGSQ